MTTHIDLIQKFDQLGATVLVEFFTNSRAPGMIQAQVKSETRRAILMAAMRENGYSTNEDTALVDLEDLTSTLTPREIRALDSGESVTVKLTPWTIRHIYGYQAD